MGTYRIKFEIQLLNILFADNNKCLICITIIDFAEAIYHLLTPEYRDVKVFVTSKMLCKRYVQQMKYRYITSIHSFIHYHINYKFLPLFRYSNLGRNTTKIYENLYLYFWHEKQRYLHKFVNCFSIMISN